MSLYVVHPSGCLEGPRSGSFTGILPPVAGVYLRQASGCGPTIACKRLARIAITRLKLQVDATASSRQFCLPVITLSITLLAPFIFLRTVSVMFHASDPCVRIEQTLAKSTAAAVGVGP